MLEINEDYKEEISSSDESQVQAKAESIEVFPVVVVIENMATAKEAGCPAFEYGREMPTLGARWQRCLDMWENYLVANDFDETETEGLTCKGKIEQRNKARFLLLLGEESVAVYNSTRKTYKSDTLKEVVEFMSTHFLKARNKFAEIRYLEKQRISKESG